MKQSRVAIFISGRGSNMEALLRAAAHEKHPAQIVAVLSNRPDAKGLAIARAYGIETIPLDHKAFADRAAFDLEADRHCREHRIDLIALAGFMRILGKDFIARRRGQILNIHPSLLPSYPGLNTHERALSGGVKVHGCTVHFVTGDLDGGPIIAQAAVPVLAEDSAESLAERVLAEEHRIYPMALDWVASGRAKLAEDKVFYNFEAERDYAPLLVPSPARR
jgi:phosphoribosylglycinamide formyltransferase-1